MDIWINLTWFEVKKIIFFYFYIFVLLLIIFIFVIEYKYALIILNIFYFVCLVFINSKLVNYSKFEVNIKENWSNILQWRMISSFSLNFTNLIWRIVIILLCSDKLAAIYFTSFAISSFLGTAFNFTFGPSIIKKKINFKSFDKIINISVIIFSLISLIYSFIYIKDIFIDYFSDLTDVQPFNSIRFKEFKLFYENCEHDN